MRGSAIRSQSRIISPASCLPPSDADDLLAAHRRRARRSRAHAASRERFVWALPQVARDGYTRLAPTRGRRHASLRRCALSAGAGPRCGGEPGILDQRSRSPPRGTSGAQHCGRDARLRFDAGPGVRSEAELGTLIAFFRARRGAARGFRLRDPFDFSSNGMAGTPTDARPADRHRRRARPPASRW